VTAPAGTWLLPAHPRMGQCDPGDVLPLSHTTKGDCGSEKDSKDVHGGCCAVCSKPGTEDQKPWANAKTGEPWLQGWLGGEGGETGFY
jgi:hypothetical protein